MRSVRAKRSHVSVCYTTFHRSVKTAFSINSLYNFLYTHVFLALFIDSSNITTYNEFGLTLPIIIPYFQLFITLPNISLAFFTWHV